MKPSRVEIWNPPVSQPPNSLHDAFTAQARAAPDRIAVCAAEEQLSFGELDRRASSLAHELKRFGAGVESCIGLCADRGVDMIIGMLAILKSGAAYVPIDPEYPVKRRQYVVDDSGVSVVVCSARTAASVAPFGARVLPIQASDREGGPDRALPRVTRENLAYIIYTSGSTGLPKGVAIEHGSVLHLFEHTCHLFECGGGDVWAQSHSISFDFSVWEIWGALLTGGRLVVVPAPVARAPGAFRSLVDEQQVTVLSQTPTAFQRFSQACLGRDPADTPLRLIIFGGEALPLRTLDDWVSSFGDARPALINMYGITETTVHVTYKRLMAHHRHDERSLIGVPIAGVHVHLLDPAGEPVPPGVPGRLYVSGPGVARGYWQRPALTAQRFLPHGDAAAAGARLYDSGDLAVRLETGDLAFLGRADNQIKISGYRIEPNEIEFWLLGHSAVAAALVVTEELDGPEAIGLVAYVVLRGTSTGSAAERDHVAAALATSARLALPVYMRPSLYRFASSFPLTVHGKIDRNALREISL